MPVSPLRASDVFWIRDDRFLAPGLGKPDDGVHLGLHAPIGHLAGGLGRGHLISRRLIGTVVVEAYSLCDSGDQEAVCSDRLPEKGSGIVLVDRCSDPYELALIVLDDWDSPSSNGHSDQRVPADGYDTLSTPDDNAPLLSLA